MCLYCLQAHHGADPERIPLQEGPDEGFSLQDATGDGRRGHSVCVGEGGGNTVCVWCDC